MINYLNIEHTYIFVELVGSILQLSFHVCIIETTNEFNIEIINSLM